MKICLISGASGGVATALASRLRSAGWRLALASRDPRRVAGHADDVLIDANVASESGAQRALDACLATFGKAPDALVNCAGAVLIAPLARTSESQYRECLAANLDTAFFLARAYAPLVAKSGQGGAMVLFSSVAAASGIANHAAIAIAKAGVEALVRSLAADFSGAGLRVNAIAPGLMETPMTARLLSSDAARKQIAAQYPLGHHGQADDGAALAAWLLSDEARWINGQIIGVDGGFAAVRPYVKVT